MQSNEGEIDSINHKLTEISETETQHSIYGVHEHLRNVNIKASEPEIISIGPYHRGKDNLKMMEEYKMRYLKLLLRRRPGTNLDTYFSSIGQLEQQARDCNAEPILLSAFEFVEMLVLDGCFIVELARKFSNRDSTCKNDPIFQMQWIMSSLQRDMILFENQIPFFVLCKLFDLIEGQNRHTLLINRLLLLCQNLDIRAASEIRRSSKSAQEVKHVLDLVYNCWMDDVTITMESSEDQVVHLERESRFIHCATKLKDASVKFEKEDNAALFDVEFKGGTMRIPPLTIEYRTECFFRNLIAYEQYFFKDYCNVITDYVTFLACLVNSSRDVEILSEHGIIDNWLGDNEVVANILNRLTISINGRDSKFSYAEMFDKVNRHYKKGWNRSKAKLRREVFYSPWAKISSIAAALLLVLTIAQTVCSILSLL